MSKIARMTRMVGITALLSVGALAPTALAADSASYQYDALGRLTQVTYANGTTVTYTYDAAGNRTQVAVSCSGSGC